MVHVDAEDPAVVHENSPYLKCRRRRRTSLHVYVVYMVYMVYT